MKKNTALITGSEGFVGPNLKRELEKNDYEVVGLDFQGNPDFKCDITDRESLSKVINSVKPNFIFHLAGFSSPSKSFEKPELCFKINVEGTRNLLDISKKIEGCRVLIVSSGEVYGNPEYLPIDEKHPLNPNSPYGESRVEQEKIALGYRNNIIVRPFNHTGPDQPPIFAIPSFRKQIAEAKNGGVIYTGNLEVVRDFSDVVDVVHAYRVLLEKGELGEIYNLGSGKGYRLRDVIESLIKDSGKDLRIETDPEKYRKIDLSKLICDNTKIKNLGVNFRNPFNV
jgi:GDP-4-dehydro-6-deoxy-D-mannose reductase